MKKLLVTIKIDMEIPDEWELVEHPDGGRMLKIGAGRHLDMSFEPMLSVEGVEDGMWINDYDDEFAEEVMDMVQSVDTEMKLLVN